MEGKRARIPSGGSTFCVGYKGRLMVIHKRGVIDSTLIDILFRRGKEGTPANLPTDGVHHQNSSFSSTHTFLIRRSKRRRSRLI